ncbi:uncharacterized protein B0H18DRAFT_1114092 [Fomitopsis serialis]|uniref:uncharacterized protein n=1 Tax=Fomitopsis serialis TaxID=139415 RepID=UPI0020086B87|nr:uncharacterized protein B0H18DRAFT_1114092 [Neoantrodia serialis]KAH9935332.1 hypothetical protein B0H18DRAFT_1114092 [Neoantrodia serialis]
MSPQRSTTNNDLLPLPDLPPELVDHVIDHLRGDAAALTACSLAHSSMRIRAQFHLFRSICVTPARWPEYEILVKKIRVASRIRQAPNDEDEIVPMFPAVTKLDLKMVDQTVLSVPLLRQVCDLNTVESIRMHICVVPTMAFVAEFICSFPRLKKLAVSDLFARDTFVMKLAANKAIDGPVPTTFRPLIETLRFPSGCTLGESMHAHLNTLEIVVVCREDAATLSALLQDLGPRLRHLYLGVEQMNEDASLSDPLTLSYNSGLRTLGFWCLKLHGDEGRPRPSLAWVPRLLTGLGSPALEHIYFRLRAGGASTADLDTLDWAAVSDILCERRFDGLRRVTIEVLRGQDMVDVLWPYIEERMAGLHARSIVRHTHVPSGI